MSYTVNYSPLLHAHTPRPPQPCHKVCDVAYSSSMKGQTLLSKTDSAVLCGSDQPDDGVPPLKAHLWPDGAEESAGMERLLRKCQIRNQLVRECLAECLGVYVLILFGCGSVAQVTTTEEKKGQYLSINLGFALGVTFGVFVSRGVSGAHLNPAVSLSLCILGRHRWLKLPFYVFFQVLGAFLAAATVGLQYYDAIRAYGGGELTVSGPTATAGIFSTYPADYLSLWGGVVDQVIGTAALLVCVLALGDHQNVSVPDGLQPMLVGLAVLVIGISMGSNSGYAINPARDIGPRLFTYIAGWGVNVFRAGGGWWWVPIVGPCVGALLGTLIYKLMIEVHHPASPFELQTSCQEATEGKTGLELEGVEPDSEKPGTHM
ncbi:aquaporin-10b [Chaetodon auriga]|uniref:aquaporin-10b n=1 Tax=Chaetodon auriga TaxID=39042 RepID=UPI004032FA39